MYLNIMLFIFRTSAALYVTCISQIFYICDLRSGQRRDLSIVSQWRKTEMPLGPCVRVGTVQIVRYQDDFEQPRWSGYVFKPIAS